MRRLSIYYLVRWLVCFLTTIDHLIGTLTLGIFCTNMGRNLFSAYFMKHLNECGKYPDIVSLMPNIASEPGWWHNMCGNSIEVHWEDVSYYGKWLNHDIVLYKAQDDDRIVGVNLSGVKQKIILDP